MFKELMVLEVILHKLTLLKKNTEFLIIVKNTGWLFADRILRMGLGLLVTVWVARYLGVEQYGMFNYASAFVALFGTISTLGLPPLIIRTITEFPDDKEKILGTTFFLQLQGGILALGITAIATYLMNPNNPELIVLVVIMGTAGIFKSFDAIELWFQSQVQSKYSVIAKNISFAIISCMKIFFVISNAPLIFFAWASLGEFVIGAAGLVIIYQKRGYSLKLWQWSLNLAQKLLKESWPLIFSGITIMIYMRVDQIMLGMMVDDEAVGLYSAATRISEVWYFIPTAIVSSIGPSIYQAKKSGNNLLYYKKIFNLLQLLNLISVGIALPMSFFSDKLILLVYGKQFAASGSILAVHIWGSLFVFMGVATTPWFIAEGLTKLAFRRTLLGAITNIVLNLMLIPFYSGIGASIATVLSQAIASFLSNASHIRSREIFFMQCKSFLFRFFKK